MNEKDIEIIRAMADLSMNVSEVSRTLFMHRNTVIYHLGRIKKETGLDPQKFCDLAELVNMVGWRPEPEGQNEQAKQPVLWILPYAVSESMRRIRVKTGYVVPHKGRGV